MPSIINALTASGGGVAITGDATGNLALQTAGNTAVTVTTSSDVGIGTTNPAPVTGFTTSRRVLQVTNSGYGQLILGGSSGTMIDHDDDANTITTIRNRYGASSASALMQLQSGYMTFGTGTSYTERMRINASGQVTTSAQPAFQAIGSGSPSIANGAVLPFSSTQCNVGNHFNTSTYTFTAPVAGIYFFSISIRWENTNSSAGYWRPDFYINNATNSRYTGALQAVAANTYAYAGQSFVVSLNAGDTCKWHYNTNGGASNNINMEESLFSGYLLG